MQGAWMNSTFRKDLVIGDPQNFGADVAPDAAPTFKVFQEGNDTPILTGTFVQRTALTNHFRLSFTVSTANGFVIWKKCVIRAEGLIHTLPYSAEFEFTVIPPVALDYNIAWAGAAVVAGSDATHVVLDSTGDTHDGAYVDQRLVKVSTTYGVETRAIFGYVGSTKTALVAPAWTNNPGTGDYLVIFADAMGTAQALSDVALTRFQMLLEGGTRDDITLDGLAAASGLTPQQVRDALKLAPSGGSPAAGSTDSVLGVSATLLTAIQAKTAPLPSSPAATGDPMTLTVNERNAVADAHLDRAGGIESGLTPRQCMRVMAAVLAGLLTGARAGAATLIFKNALAGNKNRLTVNTDANGNRTSITFDLT